MTTVASSRLETPIRNALPDGASLASKTSTSGDRGQVSRLGDSSHHSFGTIVIVNEVLVTPVDASLTVLTV